MVENELEKSRKVLGSKLRHARRIANLTQLEVATRSGVHVNFYARVERGEENPSFEKLQNIMKVLKIKSIDIY